MLEDPYYEIFKNIADGCALYELIVDDSGKAIDWRILQVNGAYTKHTGIDREMIEGKKISELFPNSIADYLPHFEQVVKTQKALEFETYAKAVNRVLKVIVTPAGGKKFASITRDITEQKRAERMQEENKEALEHTRNILTEAQNIAHLGSFEYIAASDQTIWSEEEYLIYGLDPTEPSPGYDLMLEKCIHPDDRELLNDTFTRAINNRSVYELEHRIVRPDGSIRWVYNRARPYCDKDGNLLRYVGASLDITERKSYESRVNHLMDAIQHDKEMLSALVNSIPDEIWYADKNKKFILVNPAAVNEFGLSQGQLLDVEAMASSLEVYRPDRTPRPIEESPPLLALKGQRIIGREEIIRTPGTNQLRWRQVNAAPVTDPTGNIIGSVSLVRDITESKNNEQALQHLNEQLEERIRHRTEQLSQERERLYGVLETLPVMVCLLKPDHQIAFANHSFRTKFGESRGRPCYVTCFGKKVPCEFCETFRVLETGESHIWEVTTPDGTTIEAHDFPFTDVDGSPMILEMDMDITELRRNEVHLKDLTDQMGTLAHRLLSIQEDERRSIARELHDEVGQSLTVLKLMLGKLNRSVGIEIKPQIMAISDAVSELIDEIRNLSMSLRPGVLDELGLDPALESLFNSLHKQAGLQIHYTHHGTAKYSPDIDIALYRITQEALTNVIRHAGANEAFVTLNITPGDRIELCIEDQGNGFNASSLENHRSTGLSAMEERAKLIGGICQIVSAPNKGTQVLISVPLKN